MKKIFMSLDRTKKMVTFLMKMITHNYKKLNGNITQKKVDCLYGSFTHFGHAIFLNAILIFALPCAPYLGFD